MKLLTVLLSVVLTLFVTCNALAYDKSVNYIFGKLKGEIIEERNIHLRPRRIMLFGIPRMRTVYFASNSTINGVELLDKQSQGHNYRMARVRIIRGGIGRKYIVLRFLSNGGYGYHYVMRIFSKNSGGSKPITSTSTEEPSKTEPEVTPTPTEPAPSKQDPSTADPSTTDSSTSEPETPETPTSVPEMPEPTTSDPETPAQNN